MLRRSMAAGAAVCLALGLAGCGSGPSETAGTTTGVPQQYQGLYQSAIDKGQSTITLYSPSAGELQPVFDEFAKTFPGLRVNLVHLVGVDLQTRLQGEVTSGQHVGDVVIDATAAPSMAKEAFAWYEPFIPEAAKQLPDGNRDPDGAWFAPFSGVYGVVYNTANVAQADAPKTWDDIVDPKWDGKIAMGDPSRPGATSLVFTIMEYNKLVDADWDAKLAASNPRILAAATEVGQSLTTGEADLGIVPLSFMKQLTDIGAPLDFAPDTTVTAPHAATIVKGAPSPEASQLFLTWMLSPEAQALLAERGVYPLMPNSPPPSVYDGKAPELYAPPQTFEESFAMIKQVSGEWATLLQP